jgi:hypothetical protein
MAQDYAELEKRLREAEPTDFPTALADAAADAITHLVKEERHQAACAVEWFDRYMKAMSALRYLRAFPNAPEAQRLADERLAEQKRDQGIGPNVLSSAASSTRPGNAGVDPHGERPAEKGEEA